MTIQERLKRSNIMMLVVPVLVAGVLLIAALGTLLLMLELVYLPRLGAGMGLFAYRGVLSLESMVYSA